MRLSKLVKIGVAGFAALAAAGFQPARASAAVDFSIAHVEYTQVVQNWGNTIPLVLGKPLVVRVYVQATGDPGPTASGAYWLDWPQLDIYHGSSYVTTIGPTNRPLLVFRNTDPQSYRGDTYRTYNFLLSSANEYADGTTIVVRINTTGSPAETNTLNNSLTRKLSFVTTRPLKIKGEVYVSPDHPYTDARYDDVIHQMSWVRRVWPVADAYDYGVGTYQIWTDRTNTDSIDHYWPGADTVLARADRSRAASTVYSDKTWYVLQPWNTCLCGRAYLRTSASAATGQDNGGTAADTGSGTSWTAAFGATMAQELGHSYFALLHTGLTDQDADPNCCPFGMINALDSTTFGFDSQKMQVVAPGSGTTRTHDFMSYGLPPVWVSDYTYTNLLNRLKTTSSSALATPVRRLLVGVSQSELLLAGTVGGDAGGLDETYVIDKPAGSNAAPGTGQYALDLLDAGGNVLFTRNFDPGISDSGDGVSFTQVVPYDPATARVRLRHGDHVVATMARSARAPAVQILTPGAGVHWSGPRKVTWQASDADGDLLRYAVQYSADQGQTWLTLATGLTGTSFDVDSSHLQGSRTCLVRVLASDGLNTTTAESGVFGVDRHTPDARIVVTRAEGRDRQVTLVGSGSDADDGPLTGRSLVWSSSRDGKVGTGATLVARLSPGRHTLTLTATDADGNKVTATTHVTVAAGRIPAAPARLRVSVRRRAVILRWHDDANGETHYFVERAAKARIAVFHTVGRLPRNAQSFVDRTARGAVVYRVRACDARDCSRYAGPLRVHAG